MKHFVNIQDENGIRTEEWTTEKVLSLCRTARMMDIRVRKDSVEYNFQADFIKSLI